MIKEHYTQRVQDISINIVQNEIESIRKKDIRKNALRLYKDNIIGVGGSLGIIDEAALTEKAESSLTLEIPYPAEPGEDTKRAEKADGPFEDENTFVAEMEAALADIRKAQPDFIFSHKMSMSRVNTSLSNDCGLDLSHESTHLEVGLIIREKSSPNIMDAYTGFDGYIYDRDEFVRLTSMICSGFSEQCTVKPGKQPVLFFYTDQTYLKKLYEDLHGLLYATDSSLLSGKRGEKVFSDQFTLTQSRNREDEFFGPFFDFEGTVNDGDRSALIRNGVVISPYTDRKTASRYNLPLTGASGGAYDSVPDLGIPNLVPAIGDKTVKEMLGGRPAILAYIASGGDFTPEGHFASNLQVSFLYDGEKIIGKLPEMSISGDLFEMFGSGFLGVSSDSLTTLGNLNLTAIELDVSLS